MKEKKSSKKEEKIENKEIVEEVNNQEKNEEKPLNNPIKEKYEQLMKKRYIGFNTRFLLSLITFIILLSISLMLIIMSFKKVNEQTIDYKESSNVDYKVYLKNNSFYDEKYLEKGRAYISTIIDNIDTTFMYNFNINENSNIMFDYSIVGKLMIVDANNSKVFYDKEYQLTQKKQQVFNNTKTAIINENITINYDYYNTIANEFRQAYGVNSQSYLEITLKVNGKDLDDVFKLDNEYTRSIRIPLSEREVNITIDDDNVSDVHKIISKNKLLISNGLYIVIGVISLILSILFLVKIINKILLVIVPKKSKYDKYISKILREYDRLIVNTPTAPDLNNTRIVKIDEFNELLDVRDNLKLPIKYFIVTEHQKSMFYITHDEEVYLLTVKSVDMEK